MSVLFVVFYFIKLLWLILLPALSQAGRFPCTEMCGNVSIPPPFGIADGCYPNSWFKVSCNQTSDGIPKPTISRTGLELLGSYSNNAVTVNSPVTAVKCDDEEADSSTIVVATDFLNEGPFSLSRSVDSVGVIGCGNLVSFVNNETVVGGCLQPRCGNKISNGCYSKLLKPEDVDFSTAIITKFYNGSYESKRCTSIFPLNSETLNLESSFLHDINNRSTQFPITLEWTPPVECDLADAKCQQLRAASTNPNSVCPDTCGGVDILYPFGINQECYKNELYKVVCKETPNGSAPFIGKLDLQILDVAFPLGIVTVNHSMSYVNCPQTNSTSLNVNLEDSPFLYSSIYNMFVSVGCGNLVTIFNNQKDLISSCLQHSCGDAVTRDNITCGMPMPPKVSSFTAKMDPVYPGNDFISPKQRSSCGSTFAASQFYSLDTVTITTATSFPVELEWGKPKSGKCNLEEDSKISCTSDRKYCWTNLSPTYLCVCSNFENSVSYSSDRCEGKQDCKHPEYNYCHMLGLNEPNYPTTSTEPYPYPKTRDRGIIIGCSTSIGTILLLFVGWGMYKAIKRRKNDKLRQKYFKRNGGLLLQQQLSAKDGNIDRIKLFTSKELEKATDYYNHNRVVGRGGQGVVYKGMLADGSIVAIKKSKTVEGKKKLLDDKKLEQFINEVMILSQINHRNVVKLLGCCLEIEVPLLVYEFIPNGTLYQLIEDQNDEFPLTWEMRLRIATEIGNALSYLHSAASVPIYHRDIKSDNILLDDKYRAKVSDFGISKSMALEQTHLTTRVQGTLGYIDPEYFRSNQFTDKSDVYSFGVVLIELLCGQKAISSKQLKEEGGLVPSFLLSMKENTLFDIVDSRVVNNGPEEEIVAVAKLAKRCLNLNGKKRPTMKQVVMELEMVSKSENPNGIGQSDDEDSETDDMFAMAWTLDSYSATSVIDITS